jgi:uracil-DNA glycosylase family protein
VREVSIERRPAGELDRWRTEARALIVEGVFPEDVIWIDGDEPDDLLAPSGASARAEWPRMPVPSPHVPRELLAIAERVVCHRDPRRYGLLYRVLFRIAQGERALLADPLDREVAQLRALDAAIRKDVHHAHAYVRFRKVEPLLPSPGPSRSREGSGEVEPLLPSRSREGSGEVEPLLPSREREGPGEVEPLLPSREREGPGEGDHGSPPTHWVAWHQPDHRIVPLIAPFFAARFEKTARWSLLTPDASAHASDGELRFAPGAPRSAAPGDDALEDLWRVYWSSAFDPARTNLGEMPRKHSATLPVTRAMRAAIAEAPKRVAEMEERSAALPRTTETFLPIATDLGSLRDASRGCRGCPLHATATQIVFGEGSPHARIVLVGEQPGDEDDRRGRPFVGPAGEVLDAALRGAGIEREHIYVTNAVKHFELEPRGKQRIHQRPRAREVQACRPWLEAELRALRPHVLVCLGATASSALLGTTFELSQERGHVRRSAWAPVTLATWHPSAILGAPTPAEAEAMRAELVADLRIAARSIER